MVKISIFTPPPCVMVLPLKFPKNSMARHRSLNTTPFSHSHRVSISFQCIRPEFRSVLLSFFLCGISLPYIYFYGDDLKFNRKLPPLTHYNFQGYHMCNPRVSGPKIVNSRRQTVQRSTLHDFERIRKIVITVMIRYDHV
jgi:hypothetical protein